MVRQFLAIAIAFSLMPFWTKKKLGFGPMLIITGVILSLIGGVAPMAMVNNFIGVFTTPSTLKTIIIVVIVGMLGSLMKHYGILDKIVETLKQLISSSKAIITILPAVIGLLSVPGGASLSIPFVDKIGDDMGMTGEVRSVINLSFRHIAMFLLPTSTSIIMVTTVIPDVNLYGLIAMNLTADDITAVRMTDGAVTIVIKNTLNPSNDGKTSFSRASKDFVTLDEVKSIIAQSGINANVTKFQANYYDIEVTGKINSAGKIASITVSYKLDALLEAKAFGLKPVGEGTVKTVITYEF